MRSTEFVGMNTFASNSAALDPVLRCRKALFTTKPQVTKEMSYVLEMDEAKSAFNDRFWVRVNVKTYVIAR